MREQKFFCQATCKSMSDVVEFEIVRRNELTGNLEPIGYCSTNEQLTKLLASNLNQEYLEDNK